jgi:hypothetical protein
MGGFVGGEAKADVSMARSSFFYLIDRSTNRYWRSSNHSGFEPLSVFDGSRLRRYSHLVAIEQHRVSPLKT